MLKTLTCPQCGGELHLQPGATVLHCDYCGADSLLESLAPQVGPVLDAASMAPRPMPIRRKAPFLVAGLLSGVLFAIGIALAVALPQINRLSEQQARAAKAQQAALGAGVRMRELSAQIQDAARRHDIEGQRKAQAELEAYNKELQSRLHDIWGQQ